MDSLFYNTSLNLSYRSPSQLQLTDVSEQNPGLGGIGEQFYCVSKSVEEDGKVVTKTDTLELYTIATNPETQEKTVSYLTGYPCIISETPYTYRIKGFEVYENHDDETNILQDLVYLEGAVYQVLDYNDNVVGEITTEKNGTGSLMNINRILWGLRNLLLPR